MGEVVVVVVVVVVGAVSGSRGDPGRERAPVRLKTRCGASAFPAAVILWASGVLSPCRRQTFKRLSFS